MDTETGRQFVCPDEILGREIGSGIRKVARQIFRLTVKHGVMAVFFLCANFSLYAGIRDGKSTACCVIRK